MEIQKLINTFSRLPNLGPASSRRLVLHLLRHKENVMLPLAIKIKDLAQKVVECEICFNIDIQSPCSICSNPKRDASTLCVVEELGDIWAFEKGNIFSGLYHVLGGVLSAINGVGPENLNLGTLVDRIKKFDIKEVIIATNQTLDGQVTSYYIASILKELNIKVSRPACGIPIGSEIDYLDEGTLGAALESRHTIKN